jgi:protein TonB
MRKLSPRKNLRNKRKLEDTKIGAFNQEGVKSDVVEAPVEKGTGTVEAPKAQEEDYDKEFTSVQVEAKFPGTGISFLERNLNAQTPADNGAPPGRYTVTVSLGLTKMEVFQKYNRLMTLVMGCAAEAVRVIKKGPKWNAAIQNGRNVIYRQKQIYCSRLQSK